MDVGHLPHRVASRRTPFSSAGCGQLSLTRGRGPVRRLAGPSASRQRAGPSTSGRASHWPAAVLRQVVGDGGHRPAGRGERLGALLGVGPRPAGRPGRPGPATAAAACPGSRPAGRPGAGRRRPRRCGRPRAAPRRGTAGPWPRAGARRSARPGRPRRARRPRPPPAARRAGPTSARTQPSRTRWRHQSAWPAVGQRGRLGQPASAAPAVAEADRVGGQPEQRVEARLPRAVGALQGPLVVRPGPRRAGPSWRCTLATRGLASAARTRLSARRRRPATRGSRTSSAPPYRPAEARQTPSSQPGRRGLGDQPLAGGDVDGAPQRVDPGRGPPVERRPLAGREQPREVVRHASPLLSHPARARREATVRATRPETSATTAPTADSRSAHTVTPGRPPLGVPAGAAQQQHGRRPDGLAARPRRGSRPGAGGALGPEEHRERAGAGHRVDQRPGRQPGAERPGRDPALGQGGGQRDQRQPVVLRLERGEQHRAGVAGRAGRVGDRPRSAASAHSLSRCSTSTPRPGAAPAVADPGQHREQHVVPGADHAGLRQAGPQQRRAGVAVQAHRGPGQARGRPAPPPGSPAPGRRPAGPGGRAGRPPAARDGSGRSAPGSWSGSVSVAARAASAAPTPCSISRRIRVSRARSAAV